MSIKNGDMPAMPLSCDAYQDYAGYDGTKKTSYNPQCQGLTKRETFAINAPPMPSWFNEKFLRDTSLNKGQDYSIYYGDGMSISLEGMEAAYMRWPTYYAETLLAQLEEKGDE